MYRRNESVREKLQKFSIWHCHEFYAALKKAIVRFTK